MLLFLQATDSGSTENLENSITMLLTDFHHLGREKFQLSKSEILLPLSKNSKSYVPNLNFSFTISLDTSSPQLFSCLQYG